jgi:protein transport protein SEC24
MTTWNLPFSSKLAKKCHIPLACVCQPFAEPNQNEEPVPLVDFITHGPPRCEGCRGYINPWCTWLDGGNRWRCNLCSHVTTGMCSSIPLHSQSSSTIRSVSADYYCSLDANLLRLDYQQRPELSKGTVDFAVDAGYWSSHPPPRLSEAYYSDIPRPSGLRQPSPMNYVFALDVSLDAVQSGFLASACTALATMLCSPAPLLPPESRVCILTYDNTIHFYNLSVCRLVRFINRYWSEFICLVEL